MALSQSRPRTLLLCNNILLVCISVSYLVAYSYILHLVCEILYRMQFIFYTSLQESIRRGEFCGNIRTLHPSCQPGGLIDIEAQPIVLRKSILKGLGLRAFRVFGCRAVEQAR